MMQAREQVRDPFDVLDEVIGWNRLVASREEIDALGDLATEDPLSLAASRYTQLRRFAPAFLEAFEFDAPAAGWSLQAAVELLRELNRSGRRKLPDIVPMPFASRQWRTVVASNGKTARRTYETAVVATLRDRLRAGDVWVEGSRDYRRFDAYLPPANEAEQVLTESGIETDATVWLASRRERLHERLGVSNPGLAIKFFWTCCLRQEHDCLRSLCQLVRPARSMTAVPALWLATASRCFSRAEGSR